MVNGHMWLNESHRAPIPMCGSSRSGSAPQSLQRNWRPEGARERQVRFSWPGNLEILADLHHEELVDLTMAGDGGYRAGSTIDVDGVVAPPPAGTRSRAAPDAR